MKTLIAPLILVLTASTAMAGAPCENPHMLPCQKACAVMGAKFALTMHEQAVEMRTLESAVRARRSMPMLDLTSLHATATQQDAEYLARFAGVSLTYIEGMTLKEAKRAVDEYCPR
jgi:hypothetical protein